MLNFSDSMFLFPFSTLYTCILIFYLLLFFYFRFGDVRVKMSRQMSAMWNFLKEKKSNFIPNFIGIFLEVSLLKEKGIDFDIDF